MIRFWYICTVLLLFGLTAPATAEPKELEIDAGADWSHRWTAMEFPAQWGEFTRDAIYQYEPRESNVSANYTDGDRDTRASLYIYRPGIADASIWHDRSLVALGANQAFGSENVQGTRTASFKPRGSDTESGVLTIIAASGEFRSTSVAIFSAGDWLVKLRVSSRSLDPDGLEALARGLITQLPVMKGYAPSPSYLMQACLDRIEYSTAERLRFDGSKAKGNQSQVALFSALDAIERLLNTADDLPKYCRVGDGGLEGSIYRPVGAKDRYVIAFGDSGASADASPSFSLDKALSDSSESGGNDQASKVHFLVSLSTGDKVRYFMPFLTLPQPNQAARAIMREPPFTTIERGFGDEAPRVVVDSTP